MQEVYSNLIATDRMVNYLEADKNFQIKTLNNLDALIPIFAWCLLMRAPDKNGRIEIVKGPHYQCSSATIGEAIQYQKGYFFQIAGRIIYITFSKDLEFDTAREYKININNGEVYVYPAFIDDVISPFPK